METRLTRVTDEAALAAQWLALEARVEHSFFQSWAWTGCLFAERFDDPVLVSAHADATPLALGLFNRRNGTLGTSSLHLAESGVAALDAPYIEHNGILGASGVAGVITLLRAARAGALDGRRPLLPRRLVLSGVDATHLAAAAELGGILSVTRTHIAPRVDLARLRAAGQTHLQSLSANARQQLSRSARHYAADGELTIERAKTGAEAHRFLDALAGLHQRAWTARNKPGAFANPYFVRFHHALIDRAPEAADLLRIRSGERIIGYLYNFRHRGHVLAYQSGFDYAGAGKHEKPGSTCHQLAIAMYASEGMTVYDFLAGNDRYKQSLANDAVELHWLHVAPALGEIIRLGPG